VAITLYGIKNAHMKKARAGWMSMDQKKILHSTLQDSCIEVSNCSAGARNSDPGGKRCSIAMAPLFEIAPDAENILNEPSQIALMLKTAAINDQAPVFRPWRGSYLWLSTQRPITLTASANTQH